MVSTEVETKNIKVLRAEKTLEVVAENNEEVERDLNEENIFHTVFTSSYAAEPERGLEESVVKFAIKNYCFIRGHFFQRPRRRVWA